MSTALALSLIMLWGITCDNFIMNEHTISALKFAYNKAVHTVQFSFRLSPIPASALALSSVSPKPKIGCFSS